MDHNQLTIKTFMAIMVERDAAIQERNLALEERKRSFAERDLAMLQRDAALVERNSAIQERDEAVSTLRFRGNFMSESENIPTSRESKHGFNGEEIHHMFEIETDTYQAPPENTKPTKVSKRAKSPRGGRKRADDSTQIKLEKEECSDDAQQIEAWKDELGLNQVNFDESAMPVPVCSCTGEPQPCYRWGNGGWQSACCTTIMSMYPLPQVTNKRYSRVSGRKMSGGAFTKLLTRLASQGYDLSTTLDMKDHWSKHGTNRYTTVK